MTTRNLARAVARDAVRMAARLCLAVRAETLRHPDHMEKEGREPVTIADYGAQAVILQHIAGRFPEDGTLAEERAAEFDRLTTDMQRHRVIHHVGETLRRHVSPDDIRRWLDFGAGRETRQVWMVDPIDGTKGFLRGDQFAIAVALAVEGVPEVAALACPLFPLYEGRSNLLGVIAVAIRGQGATLEPLNGGPPRRLRVSTQADITQARLLESVEREHTNHLFSAQVLERAGIVVPPIRMDSQAKYVAVADGRAEVYLRNPKGENYQERVWDHAAGMLIVEEAGGHVTDLDGKALDFSHGEHLTANRGILATNGLLHDVMLDAVQRVS
jgi:HAL2 family 3'(2'),5'-bisphosphate nucleotidase